MISLPNDYIFFFLRSLTRVIIPRYLLYFITDIIARRYNINRYYFNVLLIHVTQRYDRTNRRLIENMT